MGRHDRETGCRCLTASRSASGARRTFPVTARREWRTTRIVLGAGGPMTGVTWSGEFPKTNYEIRWEAARIDGNDFFASLTFPVGDSYCTWVTGGWGGDIVGLSSLDGWDASDNETRSYFDFDKGRWYAFRLKVTPGAHHGLDRRPADRGCRNRGTHRGPAIRRDQAIGPARVCVLRHGRRNSEDRIPRVTRSTSSRSGRCASASRWPRRNWSRGRSPGRKSSFLPTRWAIRPSSICSIMVPE